MRFWPEDWEWLQGGAPGPHFQHHSLLAQLPKVSGFTLGPKGHSPLGVYGFEQRRPVLPTHLPQALDWLAQALCRSPEHIRTWNHSYKKLKKQKQKNLFPLPQLLTVGLKVSRFSPNPSLWYKRPRWCHICSCSGGCWPRAPQAPPRRTPAPLTGCSCGQGRAF